MLMTKSFAASLGVELDLKKSLILQSVATPIRATFLVLGHPDVSPTVLLRFTPAVLPDPGTSLDWRLLSPNNEFSGMTPHWLSGWSTPKGKIELVKSAL
jgi:hypothetical protein